jgi:hypothetical protein
VQIDAGHADTTTTIYFYNNTIYGCGWPNGANGQGASGNVCITNLSRYTLHFNNNIIRSTGEPYIAGWSDGDLSRVAGGNNLWFGKGAAPSWDVSPLNLDPKFADTAKTDMHLTQGSPALNAGRDVSTVVALDFDGVTRPQGASFDIGAYEGASNAGTAQAMRSIPSIKGIRSNFITCGMPVRFNNLENVRIYNRSGRLIRSLRAEKTWNLTDDKSRAVCAGTYFFSTTMGMEKVRGAVVVVH